MLMDHCRVLEALANGCKIPNIDWEITRAIAISEYVSTFWLHIKIFADVCCIG